MDNLISVVVPIYNVAPYLNECIDSIINQTYKNLEIILVDDGSTDGSEKICDEYTKKDNRIVVIHQKNRGLVGARKAGLSIAKGEYIGYVDGDDWIEPEMYKHLLQKILETDADFVDLGFAKNANNSIIHLPERSRDNCFDVDSSVSEHIIKVMLMDNFDDDIYILPSVWSKLIKRELIIKCQNLVDNYISYGEDFICTMYMIHYATKIAYINNYYYNYRVRETSITQDKNLSKTISLLIYFLEGMYKFCDAFDYSEKIKKLANYRVVRGIVYYSNKAQENPFSMFNFNKYQYENLLEGKNIILYGAGQYGICFYNQFMKNQKINIVCWVDKNYKNLTEYPIPITAPENIKNYEFDYIVIAVKHKELADNIKLELKEQLGIDENKMLWEKVESALSWLYK